MTKPFKILLSSVSCFIFLFVTLLSATTVSAAANDMKNAKVSEEIAIFLDGQFLISKQKAYTFEKIKNSGAYVPVKLLSKIKNVNVVYGQTISVKSPKGTYEINKTNSLVYEGTTYVTFKKFLSVSGLSGEYLPKPNAIFLWSHPDGKAKTDAIINNSNTAPSHLRSYLGDKVFVYKGNQTGWITEVKSAGYGITDVQITLNNGKVINESILDDYAPDSFCLYAHYLLVTTNLSGQNYWANKNTLPSSNPLYHLEKVYFTSVKIKDQNIVITAKRASGKMVSFKLPISEGLTERLETGFYTKDPKKVFPKWPSSIWQKITQQKVSIGMTREQVILSWGYPDDSNSYTSSYSDMDQWIYGDTYLHFYDGVLGSWSDY
ncbi:hypothetical protein MNQ98_08435 [Paenibacillus sp. N3/727]|uniref:hypothetical protein n=1 Tax=Paenibacillus sp. N3/727 TaxID=2925845 RepID=UPI001F5314B3|nr:hypothetical protein [Paenibacillus sp. N3/727]UNK20029.1 hypothetical protein MNQ98_08435 [Paenibacillus sp. N3/727]